MISVGEHVTIFGMTGCGKSTLTRKLSTIYPRKVIFDRMNEWDAPDFYYVHSFDQFSKIYKEQFQNSQFTIVFRPVMGVSEEFLYDETGKILSLIYQVESYQRIGIAVIFEEVWLYAPVHGIHPMVQEMYLTSRKLNVSLVANSQRPADVSKILVSQSRHKFVGMFEEANEKKYLRDTFGKIQELESPLRPGEFLWFRPGHPLQKVTVF